MKSPQVHNLALKGMPSGFTLIELLITMAIIGILTAIAYPAYTSYIARGKIIDGHSQLAQYRIKLEQYYQDNRNYGTAGGSCGSPLPTSTYFTFTCTTGSSAQTYTATASSNVGVGLGTAANGYVYTINETNTKATTAFAGNTVNKPCWLVKGTEC
ncbi:hypothetical protein CAP31_08160 [Sulfuriferula sp. AH1]|uniref:type IV pilin protein n=1 Tax=Sulfuriferula sp. AH1 TaxID=1985873 RepID=UPI000B3B5C0C|nr:type IV pilin protein [Sulfuriferula sp. AH1]ARU32900.1 hypothetical protein CAP31_08160 [Sulfuriferula sp. AH1]